MPKQKKQWTLEKVRPKPRLKTKSKIVTLLGDLEPGDRFEFINLKKYFRKLFVKRVSFTAVSIAGEIKEKTEEGIVWKKLPENYSVATSCLVRLI